MEIAAEILWSVYFLIYCVMFWYVIIPGVFLYMLLPLLPLVWPVAFAVIAIAKRRFSLRTLFLAVTVECACLGLALALFSRRAGI